MKNISILTQSRLKEIFSYCPETGIFTRLIANSSTVKPGDILKSIKKSGYMYTRIDQRDYLVHRLAFLYITGEFPEVETDHINGIRNDNRWVNLRPVNRQENSKNKSLNRNNSSGVVGVHWSNQVNKWMAKITINGKAKYLGYFENIQDAITARKSAEDENGFHKNHGRKKRSE